MPLTSRAVVAVTMVAAFVFGFAHHVAPELDHLFQRLHIFLFNLVSGGTLLLCHAEGAARLSAKARAYFLIAMAYAICAGLELYPAVLVLSVPLAALVESTRIRRFSLFPIGIFRGSPIREKFLQASLLCLSMGIGIASLVILNNEYLGLVRIPKLELDVFFLGYSFPVSLLTLSLMFGFMRETQTRTERIAGELSFWVICVGVVVFFVFILAEMAHAEMVVSVTLLVAVCSVYALYARGARPVQQRSFLLSGMAFLVCTGLTGVGYLLDRCLPQIAPHRELVLAVHATVSLYGWNLSGMLIVMRWTGFPLALASRWAIALQWLVVLLLAPVGKQEAWLAPLAIVGFTLLVALVVLARGRGGAGVPQAASDGA